MQYVFVPLILAVLVALAWSWWTARADRDPTSSVDSFNKALTAMRPAAGRGDGSSTSPEADAGEPDATPTRDADVASDV